jgi:hypothetical protein
MTILTPATGASNRPPTSNLYDFSETWGLTDKMGFPRFGGHEVKQRSPLVVDRKAAHTHPG